MLVWIKLSGGRALSDATKELLITFEVRVPENRKGVRLAFVYSSRRGWISDSPIAMASSGCQLRTGALILGEITLCP